MLNDVKKMLGLVDDLEDDRLMYILSATESRLKNLIGGADEVPEGLEYIVTEVAVIRFNRIGSEGYASHNVGGESITFTDNDFDSYMDDINAWLDNQTGVKRGRIRFI